MLGDDSGSPHFKFQTAPKIRRRPLNDLVKSSPSGLGRPLSRAPAPIWTPKKKLDFEQ